MTNDKTTTSFKSDISRVSGSMSEIWAYVFHMSKNLQNYSDNERFSEIVEFVKKYESKIYDLHFEFDEDLIRLLKS